MAARVIVERALDPSSVGRNYHVTNPAPPLFATAVKVLREMGYSFEEVPYKTWRERLASCAADDNALRPLEGGFGPMAPPRSTFRLDCTNAGIKANTISEQQLRRDFEWCAKVGFFPKVRQS